MSPEAPDNPPSFSPAEAPPPPSSRGAQVVGQIGDRRRQSAGPMAPTVGHPLGPEHQHRPNARGKRDPLPPLIPPPSPGSRQPGSPVTPPTPPRPAPEREVEKPSTGPPARVRRRALPAKVVAIVLALVLAWPTGLLLWANGRVRHTEALSGAPDTPGTTYLLVGSDSRSDGTIPDGTEGQRSDSVLLLQVPIRGSTALVSLPRDTYVDIEGYGPRKLNAAFALAGAPLLVKTVENLTGLTIDHYVEIGMGGVVTIVDAVGGVNLCLDYDVNDPLSELVWTAGCHDVDGRTALAFARMRYEDPLGDIGRQARQRQVISAVAAKVANPSIALRPFSQIALIEAGTSTLLTDDKTGILDLGRLGLAFRTATSENGLSGTPPIADLDYRPGAVGSTVLLDSETAPVFFERLRDGELTADDFE